MSADNGIYILQTRDGYRVVHAHAIENIYDGKLIDLQTLVNYFGRCNVLRTEQEAWGEAKILYDEIMDDDFCPIIEYGVQFIKGMEYNLFPLHLIPQEEEENYG